MLLDSLINRLESEKGCDYHTYHTSEKKGVSFFEGTKAMPDAVLERLPHLPHQLHQKNDTFHFKLIEETISPMPWETFCGFVALLTSNPALWPNVKRYAERNLLGELFKALAKEYAGQSNDDAFELREERAAIVEFDGGMPRDQAERIATSPAVPATCELTPQEWQSPFPARCFDCSRQEGCTRDEYQTWGVLQRHDCLDSKQKEKGY